VARGEFVPRLVVGQRPGDAAGQPQPAQLVLLGERLVPERAQRDLQRRRPSDVALAGEQGEPVQRPGLRHRQQPERGVRRASLMLALRGEERTLRPRRLRSGVSSAARS
jgi:hypothetical protein